MTLAICFVQAVGNIVFLQLSGTIDKTYYEYYKSSCKSVSPFKMHQHPLLTFAFAVTLALSDFLRRLKT